MCSDVPYYHAAYGESLPTVNTPPRALDTDFAIQRREPGVLESNNRIVLGAVPSIAADMLSSDATPGVSGHNIRTDNVPLLTCKSWLTPRFERVLLPLTLEVVPR